MEQYFFNEDNWRCPGTVRGPDDAMLQHVNLLVDDPAFSGRRTMRALAQWSLLTTADMVNDCQRLS